MANWVRGRFELVPPHLSSQVSNTVVVWTFRRQMLFFSEHTSVAISKVYDVWKFGTMTVIEMSYVRGTSAWSTWDKLSSTQQHAPLVREMEYHAEQLRALAPPSISRVSSANWGLCFDHRLGTRVYGPFGDQDDFHRFLCKGLDLHRLDEGRFSEVAVSHRGKYTPKFTHGDLSPRSDILSKGKWQGKSGCDHRGIDWDCVNLCGTG